MTHGDCFPGTVHVREGRIADVQPGASGLPRAIDCAGRLLLPGLVEIHTDNLERHLQPRSTRWPGRMALVAHDAQVAALGITTVLDAICIGMEHDINGRSRDFIADSIAALDAGGDDLRAEHYLHYRCELPEPTLLATVEAIGRHPKLRLLSLMDHTPGQRQTADLARLRRDLEKMGPVSDEWFANMVAMEQERQAKHAAPNRRRLVDYAKAHGLRLASHDDCDLAQVQQAAAEGIGISEFPTTREAAEAAQRLGLRTVMGAPNIVLGGSQSGNLSALEAAEAGLLDSLSSDYAPVSLLAAVFEIERRGTPLPRAVAMATAEPARMLGFPDRGEIAVGLRADLVEVERADGPPRARRVWREGTRVA